MAKVDTEVKQQIKTQADQLFEIEQQVAKILGPQVFDYADILAKKKKLNINIPSLSPKAEQALLEYNSLASVILKEYNLIPEEINELSTSEQFLALSHEIYFLRYTQAKIYYPFFSLNRVLGELEIKMIEASPKVDYPEKTFLIDLFDEVIINDYGNIDIKNTALLEQKNHAIASLLSTVSEVEAKSYLMLDDFADITTKGFFSYIHEEAVLEMNTKLTEICYLYVAKEVYKYLGAHAPLNSTKQNIASYFSKIIKPPTNIYPESMKDLEAEVDIIIEQSLSKINGLKKETIQIVTQEYKELLLFYIADGQFIPTNFYEIRLRSHDNLSETESIYDILVESYIYYDNGRTSEIPVETYNLTNTIEAKVAIFEMVTHNIRNPFFTLDNYIANE